MKIRGIFTALSLYIVAWWVLAAVVFAMVAVRIVSPIFLMIYGGYVQIIFLIGLVISAILGWKKSESAGFGSSKLAYSSWILAAVIVGFSFWVVYADIRATSEKANNFKQTLLDSTPTIR